MTPLSFYLPVSTIPMKFRFVGVNSMAKFDAALSVTPLSHDSAVSSLIWNGKYIGEFAAI
jgi:hypothetical protein